MRDGEFVTPERFEEITFKDISGPNGWLLLAACNEGLELADQVKLEYERLLRDSNSSFKEIPLLNNKVKDKDKKRRIIKRFEDTETTPRLPMHVAGSDVYVFQPVHELQSGNTVNDNLVQLLQMIRTLKVHGAKAVTAVLPYHPYSRQDKPTFLEREATNAKLVADLLITAGVDGVLTYHLHSEGIRGFYEPRVKLTPLNGLDLFINIAERFKGLKDVACVSTDAGGAKFTIHYAGALELDYAIGSKYRSEQEKADMLGIIGNVEGKKIAILADDESVTVTSLSNAAEELHNRYKINEIYMLISHNKIREAHIQKLMNAHLQFGLKEFHVTDTIPQTPSILSLDFVTIHSLAERFARTINRLHYNRSVSELFYRPK